MAQAEFVSSGSISAQNTGIGWLSVKYGMVDLSVYGSFVGTTVWLQRRFEDGVILDVESYVAATEKTLAVGGPGEYRLFVKTGGYAAGPVLARLCQHKQ